jgi:hypothetical protein
VAEPRKRLKRIRRAASGPLVVRSCAVVGTVEPLLLFERYGQAGGENNGAEGLSGSKRSRIRVCQAGERGRTVFMGSGLAGMTK